MAWTALPTYATGDALTAAQLNAIKDNINESAPAKATTAGYHFVSTGTNAIAERAIISATVSTQQTRTSTSYGNLTTVGPTVTITTGTQALVHYSCQMFNDNATASCWASYAISSATTDASNDQRALSAEGDAATQAFRIGVTVYQALTAGSNVFTMQYRVGSGTGNFDDRDLTVMAL